MLAGLSTTMLIGCGGGGGSASSSTSPAPVQQAPVAAAPPTPAPAILTPDTITIGQFYKVEHGKNLQPAFQSALDQAASRGIGKVVNDKGAIAGEMWVPRRTSPYGLQTDGIPLVVTQPVDIDFAGAQLMLKGPDGGDRGVGQAVSGYDKPWLGGWLYVVGHPGFGAITIRNVTVDGGFTGSLITNDDANLTDKGFRIQDTEVAEANLYGVELRNFGGEIYYIGGPGPGTQTLEDCHFHGSAQCAFNPGGTGKLKAVNLQAGRAYQAAEVVGGKGHSYVGGRFYESGNGGATIFGGPSPGFSPDYPYSYPLWDGVGEKPWVEFSDLVFERCQVVYLGAWMRGKLRTIDAPVGFRPNIGHVRDIDLTILSECDQKNAFSAFFLDGPRDLTTQVPYAPAGTYVERPSDITLRLNCSRSQDAIAQGRNHNAAVQLYGGLVDAATIRIETSGEPRQVSEVVGTRAPGFEMPEIAAGASPA